MSKEEIFRELVVASIKDGEVSSEDYDDLLKSGQDIGLDQQTVDLMIKVELKKNSSNNSEQDDSDASDNSEDTDESIDNDKLIFKSAVSRGGSVLKPDIIIVDENCVTYKKRNKYLINFDTVSIPYSRISSVEVHSSILGTDILIDSFGKGTITVKKFTKSDAKEIKHLIEERMK